MTVTPPRAWVMLRGLIDNEAASGIVLVAAAVAAMLLANSPLADDYFHLLRANLAGLSVLHWVNDGLMALFFLLVGLEIKRETIDGQLSSGARRILPCAAALAGMIVPAAIYLAIAGGDKAAARGWATPAATDIAFALGVLTILGSRIPPSLRIFLTAVAIIDDLGAIVIIALFYTTGVDFGALAAAAGGLALLLAFNRAGIRPLWPYLTIGAIVWYFVHRSGVHATLAGVAVALTIPNRAANAGEASPLHRLEHALHPFVAFGVAPIFGLANAGLSLAGISFADLAAPVPLGSLLGLVVGKQVGVFGAVWLLCRWNVAERPQGASWRQIYGVALLCGIGFTMSLFISGLAFGAGSDAADAAKLGVICASLVSALAGWLVLAGRPT
ncbi:MAG: Na+/H+ antiporter NhaA [Janthinobacterium lividum]